MTRHEGFSTVTDAPHARLAIRLGTLTSFAVVSAMVLCMVMWTATPAGAGLRDPLFAPGVQISAGNLDNAIVGSVSCPSPGNCTEVGSFIQDASFQSGFFASETNGVWSSAQSMSDGAHFIANSVSCWTPTNCVAVGMHYDGIVQQPAVIEETNGTWGTQDVLPLPTSPHVATFSTLESVSCWGSGQCVAVGVDSDGGGGTYGIVTEKTAAGWSNPTEVTSQADITRLILWGVSCQASGACTAVGQEFNAGGTSIGVVYEGVGTSLTHSASIDPPTSNQTAEFSAVSCSDAQNCTAVGYTGNIGCGPTAPRHYDQPGIIKKACEAPVRGGDLVDNAAGFVSSKSNGVWGASTPLTSSPGSIGNAPFAVSCTSALHCTTVGTSFDNTVDQGFVSQLNGSTWSPETFLTAPDGNPNVFLTSISCSTPGRCTAIGYGTLGLLAFSSVGTLELTSTLPSGVQGVPYAGSLTASGGSGLPTFSITSGALAPGLSLNTATGAITGTPQATGAFTFTVSVSDPGLPAQSVSAQYSITIAAALAATGFSPLPLLGAAGILLLSGALLQQRTRRKRSHSTH